MIYNYIIKSNRNYDKERGIVMYNALVIAKWFLLKNNAEKKEHESDIEEYEGITHLKLQKLLYYAQGINIAIYGKPLFNEAICAWRHGPVVEDVYQVFKPFGSNPIVLNLSEYETNVINSLDEKTIQVLNLTYDNFAIYTAWQLRNMTHEDGTPWDMTVKENGANSEIPLEYIETYFKENVVDNGK